jgi:hypothetical protein
MLKGQGLVKKRYRFSQELEVLPRRDMSFAKREKISQEKI